MFLGRSTPLGAEHHDKEWYELILRFFIKHEHSPYIHNNGKLISESILLFFLSILLKTIQLISAGPQRISELSTELRRRRHFCQWFGRLRSFPRYLVSTNQPRVRAKF